MREDNSHTMLEPACSGEIEAGEIELPSTSVVIPTYNRSSGLREVVGPLLEDSFLKEIVVVVDGSEDGSMEVLEELALADARLVPLWIPNGGEMAARGAGAARASTEVLLFLDDDVRISPGLSRRHAAWHACAERLVVLGYMPIPPLRGRGREGFATSLYSQEYERACVRYERDPTSVLRHLWAGNMSIRRADALAVGFHNPAYDARYHQDREFGLRCLRDGMVGVFDRGLRAEHLHSRSLAAFRRDARAQGEGAPLLLALHGDLSAPDSSARGLRGMREAVLGALVRISPYRPTSAALVGVLRATHSVRLSGLAQAAARLLRLVERRRGELAGRRRSRAEMDP